MNYTSTLTTARLTLRPLTPDDFSAVHSWASDPENVRYMAWGPNSEEDTRTFLTDFVKLGRDFAVVLKESGAVIGSCGIYPDAAEDTAELGWILHKAHHKRGYGTEIAAALIKYGFEELRLRRITADCVAVNYGSYRVMERAGMRREATRVKTFWARIDKKWIDRADYAILAEEYFSVKPSPSPHKIIDITQPLPSCAVYPGDTAPTLRRVKTIAKDGCSVTDITMCAHNGTHADAPLHFIDGGGGVSELPLDVLCGECVVRPWDGAVPQNCRRLLIKGEFSLSQSDAETIVRSGVLLLGVEAQSVGGAEIHRILLAAGVVILEGLVLQNAPVGRYNLCALPLNTGDCDGAPIRAVLM